MLNEAWFHQKLDYVCRRLEVTPVGFYPTHHGPVYIAEAWQASRPDKDCPGSGWTVLWAVKHRGMCVAQGMYLPTAADPETRKGAAIQKALEYLGTYHGQALASPPNQRAV